MDKCIFHCINILATIQRKYKHTEMYTFIKK